MAQRESKKDNKTMSGDVRTGHPENLQYTAYFSELQQKDEYGSKG